MDSNSYLPDAPAEMGPRAGEVYRGRPGKFDDKTRLFTVRYVEGSFVMCHVLGPDAEEFKKPRTVANVTDFSRFKRIK